jgi:alpha-N-arabinofuranosidase
VILARIDIDVDRPIGSVDPRIFGGFIEHLGRCIYGGIFDEGSALADEQGFRTDVLGAVRDLRPPHVRWPGGNFVSGYHWVDGIGPRAQRPRRPELAWHSEESNRFGTDEFMAWCQEVGTAPVICLNMGTGTMDEALAWVEYCNGDGNTYWANRRRANGHTAPYNVRYWGLGNEVYGDWQIGQRSAEDYVATARQWAKAIKLLDPTIALVSCGQTGVDDWDRIVIDGLAPLVDFHSIHLYTGSDDYWSDVLAPHYMELTLDVVGALIQRARHLQGIEHEISVAYDEWNVWYRTNDGQLEEQYTLADALAVATYLNVFVRRCRTVRMANLAQLVNVIAPIVTSPDGIVRASIYYPLQLLTAKTRELALSTFVDSGTHDHRDLPGERRSPRIAALGPFQLLDVAATCDTERRHLTVSVVNRDPDHTVNARINLHGAVAAGALVVHEVNGERPDVVNTFEHPDQVTAHHSERHGDGDHIDMDFPAHSLCLIEVELVVAGMTSGT